MGLSDGFFFPHSETGDVGVWKRIAQKLGPFSSPHIRVTWPSSWCCWWYLPSSVGYCCDLDFFIVQLLFFISLCSLGKKPTKSSTLSRELEGIQALPSWQLELELLWKKKFFLHYIYLVTTLYHMESHIYLMLWVIIQSYVIYYVAQMVPALFSESYFRFTTAFYFLC